VLTDLKTWLLFFCTAFTSLQNGEVKNVSFFLSIEDGHLLTVPLVPISDHQKPWPPSVSHAAPWHASRCLLSNPQAHCRSVSHQTSQVTLHHHCLPLMHRLPPRVSYRRSTGQCFHLRCFCIRLPAQSGYHCPWCRWVYQKTVVSVFLRIVLGVSPVLRSSLPWGHRKSNIELVVRLASSACVLGF
jgi:hypothetical protein